jgi:hypothetical protein
MTCKKDRHGVLALARDEDPIDGSLHLALCTVDQDLGLISPDVGMSKQCFKLPYIVYRCIELLQLRVLIFGVGYQQGEPVSSHCA